MDGGQGPTAFAHHPVENTAEPCPQVTESRVYHFAKCHLAVTAMLRGAAQLSTVLRGWLNIHPAQVTIPMALFLTTSAHSHRGLTGHGGAAAGPWPCRFSEGLGSWGVYSWKDRCEGQSEDSMWTHCPWFSASPLLALGSQSQTKNSKTSCFNLVEKLSMDSESRGDCGH